MHLNVVAQLLYIFQIECNANVNVNANVPWCRNEKSLKSSRNCLSSFETHIAQSTFCFILFSFMNKVRGKCIPKNK